MQKLSQAQLFFVKSTQASTHNLKLLAPRDSKISIESSLTESLQEFRSSPKHQKNVKYKQPKKSLNGSNQKQRPSLMKSQQILESITNHKEVAKKGKSKRHVQLQKIDLLFECGRHSRKESKCKSARKSLAQSEQLSSTLELDKSNQYIKCLRSEQRSLKDQLSSLQYQKQYLGNKAQEIELSQQRDKSINIELKKNVERLKLDLLAAQNALKSFKLQSKGEITQLENELQQVQGRILEEQMFYNENKRNQISAYDSDIQLMKLKQEQLEHLEQKRSILKEELKQKQVNLQKKNEEKQKQGRLMDRCLKQIELPSKQRMGKKLNNLSQKKENIEFLANEE